MIKVAKTKQVIGDPSYFPNKIRKVGKVVRAICMLKHQIPNTDDADSIQLVIPQNQINRKHGMFTNNNIVFVFVLTNGLLNLYFTPFIDIYIASVSSSHNVCAKDYFLA